MASGECLPARVKAVVADCGYTRAADVFAYQAKKRFHLPAWLVMPFYMVRLLYEAAGERGRLFTVPGAGHGESRVKDPECYWDEVRVFIDRAF